MRHRSAAAAVMALAALGMLPAGAIPPPPESFDGETIRCQPSGSAVTVLICRDAELLALDAQLRTAFRRVREDPALSDGQRASLVTDQLRWVQAMDECWREGKRMRDCVKASQERRLRQLQGWVRANVWQLL